MKLIKNVVDSNSSLEGEVFFGLFDRYISFFSDGNEGKVDLEYVNQCAVYLNSLSEDLIDRLCQGSIMYCNTFLDDIGEEAKQFANYRDVLPLITPLGLSIPEKNRNEPVIHLELDCEWEPEHGMEWIVREDRILYIGSYDGEDPWGEFADYERFIDGGNFYNFAC